jgi:hypothetical protein
MHPRLQIAPFWPRPPLFCTGRVPRCLAGPRARRGRFLDWARGRRFLGWAPSSSRGRRRIRTSLSKAAAQPNTSIITPRTSFAGPSQSRVLLLYLVSLRLVSFCPHRLRTRRVIQQQWKMPMAAACAFVFAGLLRKDTAAVSCRVLRAPLKESMPFTRRFFIVFVMRP